MKFSARRVGMFALAAFLGGPIAAVVFADPSADLKLLLAVWLGWLVRALVQVPTPPLVVAPPPPPPLLPSPPVHPSLPWAFHPHGSEAHVAAVAAGAAVTAAPPAPALPAAFSPPEEPKEERTAPTIGRRK